MHVKSAQQLLFANLTVRSVVAMHAGVEMTSAAGLIPIRECDFKWRFTERMVDRLTDKRTVSATLKIHSMSVFKTKRISGTQASGSLLSN